MNSAQLPHLIKMVNQIAAHCDGIGDEQKAFATAEHIRKFWSPSMRRTLIDYAIEDGAELSFLARKAVTSLSQ